MPSVARDAALDGDDGSEQMRGVVIGMSALVRRGVHALRCEFAALDPHFHGR